MPCSNAPNIGESKTWTQCEFCTWQNSAKGQVPPKMHIYTVNHKKRDILFLTISLANINRFLQFLCHFNLEEILHATVVKFTTSP